jgi:hypothetical protein
VYVIINFIQFSLLENLSYNHQNTKTIFSSI